MGSRGEKAERRRPVSGVRFGGGPLEGECGRKPELFLGLGVVLGDGVPVDDVPPGLDIVGPAVLILQVVGVLPDVQAHYRLAAGHDGIVLVRGGFDDELAVLDVQPGPARAEARGRGLRELGLEVGERAEGGLDGCRQLARGLAPAALLHDLPEHRVITVPAAVVANSRPNVFGDLVQAGEQGFQGKRLQLSLAFECLVQVVDVGGVVLAVMDLHRHLVNVGFERIESIGKRWKLVGHRTLLLQCWLLVCHGNTSSVQIHVCGIGDGRYSNAARGAAQLGRTCAPGSRSCCWVYGDRSRPSAQRACSAMTASSEPPSRSSNATIREWAVVPACAPEFPRATQALRTKPRHLARFTALPRKTSRYSSSPSDASHSSAGAKSDTGSAVAATAEGPVSLFEFLVSFVLAIGRGKNAARVVSGAWRFHGQTSWQMSQPNTIRPMAGRNSSGIVPRSSMVR